MNELERTVKKMNFLGCPYLDSKVFPKNKGVEVTIKSLKMEAVKNIRTGKDEQKKVLYFEEFDQGMIVGAKENAAFLLNVLDERNLNEVKDLVGQKVKLGCDPSVRFGPKVVGALRFFK